MKFFHACPLGCGWESPEFETQAPIDEAVRDHVDIEHAPDPTRATVTTTLRLPNDVVARLFKERP